MIAIVKTVSTAIVKGYRIIKSIRFGKADVIDGNECSPFGVDSNPVKGMDAIYASTNVNGIPVIIGYLNKNRLAKVGENRIYATDEDGIVGFNIWLKKTSVLIGRSVDTSDYGDNLVRYLPLNTALQDEINQINNQLLAIAAAINAIVPGSYTPTLISVDFSSAKTPDIYTT